MSNATVEREKIQKRARVVIKDMRMDSEAVIHGWLDAADTLDAQGEVILAGEVRHFAATSHEC